MHKSIALVALSASMAVAQGVTAVITPTAPAPSGCVTSYPGTFEITALNITKRDLSERGIEKRAVLTLTLQGGKLTDAEGRTGYIAANHQFQFDEPPQTGAIYTAGWSACPDGALALGGSTTFYTCASGNPDGGDDGAFYNIYDDQAFDICNAAELKIIGGSAGDAVSQQPDGQPTVSPVSQITDGQIQVPTGTPVSQISDGQIQVPTGNPISQISDGQPQAPSGIPISQISDGQPQAPSGIPVSQISDGQPQAPSGIPVSQISDGQPQVPSGIPISQISDGQPQVPTQTIVTKPSITGAPVTQISDGQIQVPTATGPVISQISDGQIQAPTGSNLTATSTPVPFTGSAASLKAGLVSVVIAVIAIALL